MELNSDNAMYGVIQICFMPAMFAALRTAIDLDLFAAGESIWQLEEVAVKKNVDPILLQRIVRILCSYKIFQQLDGQRYGPTPMSLAFAIPAAIDWVKYNFDLTMPVIGKLPEFLKSTSYRNPDGVPSTLSKSVLGMEWWDYLAKYPELGQQFDSAMSITDQAPPVTNPNFPYMEQALAAVQKTEGLPGFLDIGGGRGQYAQRLLTEMPDIECEFIVQDLEPTTATNISTSPKMRGMVYNFFEPQPIKGARWYHFRRVLHDWSDAACQNILARTHEAMKKGYSTLLLQDAITPEKDCPQVDALIDYTMSIIGGMERTQMQWERLLSGAGFRIIKIWPAQAGTLAIIEAEAVGSGERHERRSTYENKQQESMDDSLSYFAKHQ